MSEQILSLQNVRCHRKLEVPLNTTTVVVGKNGSGKTAILEALSILSVGKTWRTDQLHEVISYDTEVMRITVNSNEREVALQRNPRQKVLKILGKSTPLSQWVGSFPTVLFHPEDSLFITGSPTLRRSALDRLLSQAEQGYITLLQKLQRCITQRNSMLRRISEGLASFEELDVWDQELAALVEKIEPLRKKWITALAPKVARYFSQLVPEIQSTEVIYQHSPSKEEDYLDYAHYLSIHRQRDSVAGVTLAGPHRANIQFLCDQHPADEYLSRGQQRALVVAWKLAEVDELQSASRKVPLLLFDDVFAELDSTRREVITELLATYPVIVTATDEPHMPPGAQVVRLP